MGTSESREIIIVYQYNESHARESRVAIRARQYGYQYPRGKLPSSTSQAKRCKAQLRIATPSQTALRIISPINGNFLCKSFLQAQQTRTRKE